MGIVKKKEEEKKLDFQKKSKKTAKLNPVSGIIRH